ncbi:MAG: M48 family metallopeptidase [Betaproteobacteria bacterium]
MPAPEPVSRDARSLTLAEGRLDYVLVRRRGRRGVGLKVDENGLTVNAPLSMPVARIEALVRESEAWVLRKIDEWRSRRAPPIAWADGARLPFLGGGLTLRLALAGRTRVERVASEVRAAVRAPDEGEIRRAIVAWYKREALAYLHERVLALSASARLQPPRVMLSSALARWGSCNTRREVRLAWRLMKAPPELIDYVICHELAHLRHMDHSGAFWAEVERQCPNYRQLRARLFDTDYLYRSF